MADLNLPQTKYAQKLKPYEGPLPSYIRLLDDHAARAGLTIRRLRDRDCIVLAYSGRREEIGRFGLLSEAGECIHWPSGPRAPANLALPKVVPTPYPSRARLFKIEADRYAIQITAALPRSASLVCQGVEYFDFNDGSGRAFVSYVGDKQVLVAQGITSADAFPDDTTDEGRSTSGLESRYKDGSYWGILLEQTKRLHGDKWACIKYPQEVERAKVAQAQKAQEGLSDYSTPDEWLEELEDFVCSTARVIQKDCSVETKAGVRYSVSAADLKAISDELEAVAQRIRNIPVKVQLLVPKSTPETRKKAAAASSDGKFQSFMQSIITSAHRRKHGGDQ